MFIERSCEKLGGLHLLPTSNWFLFETVGTNIEILYSRFELHFEKYSKSSFFVRWPFFMCKKCSGSFSNYTLWRRVDSNEESSRFYSISESTESNSIQRKIAGNSGMVHLAKVNLTPPPLLNVPAYWQSSNSEACTKRLSQILAKNIDNGGRGIGLRIYVRYCLKKINEK